MKVLYVRNVREALPIGIAYLEDQGSWEDSRAGRVLVSPCPVTTVYEKPNERVLIDPVRDANPFFHLFESIHMLAGRNDATWLDQFVKDFSSRFAEADGVQHGAYGYRWRKHFDMEGGGNPFLPDQLDTIVKLLVDNPNDRQAVLTMWDPAADLGVPGLKDRPCNTHVYFRIRQTEEEAPIANGYSQSKLDITVCCRSNDIVWGAYGANAVHFSVLQEYMAARIGVGIGKYRQSSNNYHIYENIYQKMKGVEFEYASLYGETKPIVTAPEAIDRDIQKFMEWSTSFNRYDTAIEYDNKWFAHTAEPLFSAYEMWRGKEYESALSLVNDKNLDMAPDWRRACREWMQRRLK